MIGKYFFAECLPAVCSAGGTAGTGHANRKKGGGRHNPAPNGDLILGSTGSAKIYRAKKGSNKADVFIDASAEGAVSFLGVLADAPTGTLWACQIYPTPDGQERSALRGFDLKKGGAKFRWELPGIPNLCNDFVVGPDKALYISDTFGAKI